MILFGLTEHAAKRLESLWTRAGTPPGQGFRLTMTGHEEDLRLDDPRVEDVVFRMEGFPVSIHMDRRTAETNSGKELDYSESEKRFGVVTSARPTETTHWLSPEPGVGVGKSS